MEASIDLSKVFEELEDDDLVVCKGKVSRYKLSRRQCKGYFLHFDI